MTTTSLAATDDIILNPERGFYRTLSLVYDRDYAWVRQAGFTLAHSYVRLDDYREQDLDAQLLDAVHEGFDHARAAGIKIILRCAYNFGPYPNSEPDASKDWVLTHIDQLRPVLQANADVIAVMQAGFIGAWGEWHTSTNGLLDNPQDKFDILEAILSALPGQRMVQLRYPPYKEEGYGGPLDENSAHSGLSAARIGHHNDCFLASDDDWGTWPTGEIEQWKNYVEADTLYVMMGGETCNVNPPRSECATALSEMQRFHYTYINHEYHPDVVAGWTAGGCREEMERKLGYRLWVDTVTGPPEIRPGGVMPLTIVLQNDGWAAPMNPRPVLVVMDGPERHEAVLATTDLRWWIPGEEARISVRLQLPASTAAGAYRVALWLPDAAPALEDDSRYAIRLANDSTWEDDTGLNILFATTVSDDAPGSSDPSAEEFRVLE